MPPKAITPPIPGMAKAPTPRTPGPPPPSGPVTPKATCPVISNEDPPALGEKIVLMGVEGYGKTTIMAHAPDATIMMSHMERGYLKLRESGRVPKCPYATCKSWEETMALLDHFIAQGCSQWLGIDALGGFEQMLFDKVCREDFEGKPAKFNHYHKGQSVAVTQWQEFIQKLETIASKGTNILAACHYQIREMPNPMGQDFQRYMADLAKETWPVTNRWADDVLFGTFFTVTTEKKSVDDKVKGVGGTDRVLYASHFDTVQCKNKWGMDPIIYMPDDYTQMFAVLWEKMRGAKE